MCCFSFRIQTLSQMAQCGNCFLKDTLFYGSTYARACPVSSVYPVCCSAIHCVHQMSFLYLHIHIPILSFLGVLFPPPLISLTLIHFF